MKRFSVVAIILVGCTTPTTPESQLPPPLPVPLHHTTPTGDSIWLYRDSLYGYGQYLKHYMDSLTMVYRLPPFHPPLAVDPLPPPPKPECVGKPIKLPNVPNIALTETPEEERDLLISHIEDLRRLVTLHNRSLCKP